MSTIKRIVALAAVLAWTGMAAWAQPEICDLTTSGATCTVAGATLKQGPSPGSAGTGNLDPFYRISGKEMIQGYNTGGTPQFDTDKAWTEALLLSTVTQIDIGGVIYREFFLDINQTKGSSPYILDRIEIWTDADGNRDDFVPGTNSPGTWPGTAPDLEWSLLGPSTNVVHLNYDLQSGSGVADMTLFVPDSYFPNDKGKCDYGQPAATCGVYVYHYSRFQGNNAGFEEWATSVQPFVQISKTIVGTATDKVTWEITKDVNPKAWDLFKGDKATSTYTVEVTKDVEFESAAVSGTIVLHVPSKLPDGDKNSPDADVLSVLDEFLTYKPTVVCPSPVPFTIKAGNTVTCTYSIPSLSSKLEGINTATANVYDPNVDGPRPFSATAAIAAGEYKTATEGDATVSVEDNFDSGGYVALGTADATKTFTYDRDFVCGTTKTYNNTARIVQGNKTATAAVEVMCHDLGVAKDATTYLKRKWSWDIDKKAYTKNLEEELVEVVDPLNISVGSDIDVYYEITVGTTGDVDSEWMVKGNITITNPHPTRVAKITDVTDVISGPINATVDCKVTFPYEIAANGGKLECEYEAVLPDGTDRTNTATATLQNYWFNKVVDAGPPIARDDLMDGTTNFSGNAAVSFAKAEMTKVDDCVDVTDDYGTPLDDTDDLNGLTPQPAIVCYDDDPMPAVLKYMRNFEAGEEDCTEYTVENTATFMAPSKATGSDVASVTINVPCAGCTYTQGYWKTHNDSFWGGASKKADPAWCLLGNFDGVVGEKCELEGFFKSGDTFFGVMWTPPAGGNSYYSAAHQWIAAYLNVLNGATLPQEVLDAWTELKTMFEKCTPAQTGEVGCEKAMYTKYASILDDYNNGYLGVPHCDDEKGVEEDGGEKGVKADKDKKVGPGARNSESDETEATYTPATVGTPAVTADSEGRAVSEVPNAFGIANYPNPFNPQTTISIAVPELSHVSVAIFDLMGRFVAQLVDGSMPAGTHTITWSAEQLPSGTYFLMMRAGEFAQTRQMTLLK